jgi:hypothetical protein
MKQQGTKFTSLETAMLYLQADPLTSDPVEILAAREEMMEPIREEPAQPNPETTETTMPGTSQVARFFSEVTKTDLTWTTTCAALAYNNLSSVIYNLYRKYQFAELNAMRDNMPTLNLSGALQKVDEKDPDLDERNASDEETRTDSVTGHTPQQQQRRAQGFNEDDRNQQLTLSTDVYVAAIRELDEHNCAHLFPDAQRIAVGQKLNIAKRATGEGQVDAAMSKYVPTGYLDKSRARQIVRREDELNKYDSEVFADLQAMIDNVWTDVEIESAFAKQDILRQHTGMIRTIENLVRDTQYNAVIHANADSAETRAATAANVALLSETLLNVEDITNAFVRENHEALNDAHDKGRMIAQVSERRSAPDRNGNTNLSPAEWIKNLRSQLKRPYHAVVKAA